MQQNNILIQYYFAPFMVRLSNTGRLRRPAHYTSISTIMTDHDSLIAPFIETQYLVLSSCSFLYPAYIGIQNSLYIHSFMLFVTVFISANYWRKATLGLRRTIDLILAKIVFVFFLVTDFTM